MRHWHKRWFVLESPGKLLYYSDKDKTDLKGIIPLDMIEKMLFRATRLTLLMEGASETAPPRKFSLKGESDDVVSSWGTAINKAFEELDRIEEEEEVHDKEMDDIGEGDSKYWKVETRKKLNLSVGLEDKPKKKKGVLKIDRRAKEIEAQIAEKEVAERKLSVVAQPVVPAPVEDVVSEPARHEAVVDLPPQRVAAAQPVAPAPVEDVAAEPVHDVASEPVQQEVAAVDPPPQRAAGGYIPLVDDYVAVSPPSSSSPAREEEDARQAEQADRDRVERQRARELQEEADLVAAIAASQMEPPTQPVAVELEG